MTSDELCDALDRDDLPTATAVLSDLVSKSDAMRRDADPDFATAIQHLVDWLMQCRCLVNVSVCDGVLKTYPPQKVLLLTARRTAGNRVFRLKLRLGATLEVHAIEG